MTSDTPSFPDAYVSSDDSPRLVFRPPTSPELRTHHVTGLQSVVWCDAEVSCVRVSQLLRANLQIRQTRTVLQHPGVLLAEDLAASVSCLPVAL